MGEPQNKGNGLAIVALVLAALFFVPLVPLVGLVLGIVALATGRSKPISIVAVCLGAFFTLMMGVYAAIAIPAFMKFVDGAKRAEANATMGALTTALQAQAAASAPSPFESDWMPAGSACTYPDHKFPADPAAWDGEPWKTLGFRIDGPHYFQYRLRRRGCGTEIEARADLRCDGHLTELSRVAVDCVE